MDLSVLSMDENMKMTKDVLSWHEMPEGEKKEEMKASLIKRTEELIYLIPIEKGYLKREDACGFYLEQRKNSETILRSYTISKLFYNDYISQIIRVRCINFIQKMRKEEADRMRISYEEGREVIESVIEVRDSVPEYVTGKERGECLSFSRSLRTRLENMDMRELCSWMIRHTPGNGGKLTLAEKTIRERIKGEKKRAEMVFLLLYLPVTDLTELSRHIALSLGVPEFAVERLMELKKEASDERWAEKIEENRAVMNKHFRQMLKYESALLIEADPEKRMEIRKSCERLRRAYENRLGAINRSLRGLTQREIAAHLRVSRSLVSLNIKKAWELLIEIEQELVLQERA